MNSKTDPNLGKKVNEYLVKLGVETPFISEKVARANLTKVDELTELFTKVWDTVGLDLLDDSICDTPRRMAKMYINEIYYGLDYNLFPKCTAVENKMGYDEILVEKNINVQSNCEHHGVVISGLATVGYFPGKKVIGLSKINRLVEFFSKRPAIQERLTEQIYHALSLILETKDVAVVIEAEHYCVKSRGIRDVGSSTLTSRLGGRFLLPEVRSEFFSLRHGTR